MIVADTRRYKQIVNVQKGIAQENNTIAEITYNEFHANGNKARH